MKKALLYFLLFSTLLSFSQKLSVSGHIQDTAAKVPLNNAIVMAIKLMDSTLVEFTRTNDQGYFKLKALPIDTYQVVISHPKFADQGYFIFGDTKNLEYDFGKIILQPKSMSLDEVTIFAFKDPIYYKGDTLIYTADSFKTKTNATVEDLLKKLPGIKVDAQGKITSQGKKVDKVLVDGDEFFGSDPTIATKNLNANTIESVQVYEKKSDDVANSSTGEETQKILNLVLKDEAKKGYFGKVTGASDFREFYESEALASYFKNKLKISVFGLGSNTPRSSLDFWDSYKYGLGSIEFNEDEDTYSSSFSNENFGNQGIPKTLKSGFYYSDKISKNTKLNFNYTYDNNQLITKTTTNSQYFLADTSYSTSNEINSIKNNEAHTINFELDQKIDSLTDITLKSSLKVMDNNSSSNDQTDFVRSDNIKTRNTSIDNSNKGNGYNMTNSVELSRHFKKKDRLLIISYNNALSKNESKGILKTDNYFYTDTTQSFNYINQQKNNLINNQTHTTGFVFTEPFTKKIKVELSYDFMYYQSKQDKRSLNNISGEYILLDSTLTNNFINTKQINRAGIKCIYEIKKLKFTLGTKARTVFVNNNNTFKNQVITQNFNNVLPFSTLSYKFTENKSIRITYKTNSTNPTINQLQPIIDNTNPNFINIGNPNLLPTFSHATELSFNSYKPISGKYIFGSLSYNVINDAISTSTYYDSIGRTVTKAININGNKTINGNIGTNIPFFSKKLELSPSADANYMIHKSYINNQENITRNIRSNIGMEINLNLENFTATIKGYMEFNASSSSLNPQSNKPYASQGIEGSATVEFPRKFILKSDADYIMNSKRSNGYNINYLVWNASISKTLLKNENLILGLHAYDLLNQNINISRNISSNVITDTKTNIITQYFLAKATFKFNSNKTKDEEDEY